MIEYASDGHRGLITYNGETKPLREWAKALGITRTSLYVRIHRYGWTIEEALTTPKDAPKRAPKEGTWRASFIRWVEVDGERVSLLEACRREGVSYPRIRALMRRHGLTPEGALARARKAGPSAKPITVVLDGRRMKLADACEVAGLPYLQVRRRIVRAGWDPELALSTPLRRRPPQEVAA